MYRALDKTLAVVLIITLAWSPALSALAHGCGCGAVYEEPVISSCECYGCGCGSCEPSCGGDCGDGCGEVVVEHVESSCGCGEVVSESSTEPVEMESTKPALDVTPTPQPRLNTEEPVVSDPKPVTDVDPAPVEELSEPKSVEPSIVTPPPTVQTPPPVEQPAATPVDDNAGSLFEEAETTEAAQPEPANDLFDEPASEAQPAEETPEPAADESSDDLFGEPATESPAVDAPAETPTEESFDNLFGDPDSLPAAEEQPAAEEAAEPAAEPAEEKEDDDYLDDLFSKLEVPGGLQSQSLRKWTDNTARYHCQARLLDVAEGEVMLLKDDGSQKRVSLRRLSQQDLQFVYSQVVVQRELLAKQGTGEKLASLWAQ